MTRVNLPAYSPLCWADSTQVDCDYPLVIPRKLAAAIAMVEFSDIATIARNFALGETEQETIMARINYDNLTLPEAACEWLKKNEATWKQWIPTHNPTTQINTNGVSSATTISGVAVIVGVVVSIVVIILCLGLFFIYFKKGKRRRELNIAPGGVVALVFTDIQV